MIYTAIFHQGRPYRVSINSGFMAKHCICLKIKSKGYLFQRLLKHIFDPKISEHRQTWSYHFTDVCSQLATANQGICTDFFSFLFPKSHSVCRNSNKTGSPRSLVVEDCLIIFQLINNFLKLRHKRQNFQLEYKIVS